MGVIGWLFFSFIEYLFYSRFGPKTGYLQCKYELPDMKGDGDLKWSFVLGDLYIKVSYTNMPTTIKISYTTHILPCLHRVPC